MNFTIATIPSRGLIRSFQWMSMSLAVLLGPEAFIEGLLKLREKIAKQGLKLRDE